MASDEDEPSMLCFGTRVLRAPELYSLIVDENAKEATVGSNYTPPRLVVDYLTRNAISRLKKRSSKFPKAPYYCSLCDYHCSTLLVCVKHVKQSRHSNLAAMRQVDETIRLRPKESEQHLKALEKFIQESRREHGLNELEMEMRRAIADDIHQLLDDQCHGCSVNLHGSSLSGFGLIGSALDLDLVPSNNMKQHMALIKAHECIQGWDLAQDVKKDFDSSSPRIQFRHRDRECILSLSNRLSVQTSLLLRDYMRIDERVALLSTTIRRWARTVDIDRQEMGFVSPHTFDIMLIFFLQSTLPPVLPVIHELYTHAGEESYNTPTDELKKWQSTNYQNCGELLVHFFSFYAVQFRFSEQVVSIRVKHGLSKEQKKWPGSKLSVEDPYALKRSLTRGIQGTSNFDYFMSCFKLALLYFGTAQTKLGPVITRIAKRTDADYKDSHQQGQEDGEIEGQLWQLQLQGNNDGSGNPSTVDEDLALFHSGPYSSVLTKYGTELTVSQASLVSNLVPYEDMIFQLDKEALTRNMLPTEHCSVCNSDGHMQSSCPDVVIHPKEVLKPLDTSYKSYLDKTLRSVMFLNQPLEAELLHRAFVVKTLTKFIRHTYPTAILTLFGSSCNGFNFSNSDLDLSLTFEEHETAKDLDAIDIIESLAKSLNKMRNLRDVVAITTAKVPIVKFVFLKERCPPVMGDISLYNVLAQENTRMLRFYAALDDRVRILGYLVKHFAKLCDIGDASRGTLSSYAYILMVIHFLQQRQPPVVPVLQALHNGEELPKKMVEGWNAWFFDNFEVLPYHWPNLFKNQERLSDLWIGFLEYYAHDFESQSQVVSIRQVERLSKFEKMWTGASFAIEDPFDLSHNLAAGLSRQMNAFIKRTFANARIRFGKEAVAGNYPSLLDYLWDKNRLVAGPMPNDRGCRGCGRVGHFVRDCPRKKQNEAKLKQARCNNEIKDRSRTVTNVNHEQMSINKTTTKERDGKITTKNHEQNVVGKASREASRVLNGKQENTQRLLAELSKKVPPCVEADEDSVVVPEIHTGQAHFKNAHRHQTMGMTPAGKSEPQLKEARHTYKVPNSISHQPNQHLSKLEPSNGLPPQLKGHHQYHVPILQPKRPHKKESHHNPQQQHEHRPQQQQVFQRGPPTNPKRSFQHTKEPLKVPPQGFNDHSQEPIKQHHYQQNGFFTRPSASNPIHSGQVQLRHPQTAATSPSSSVYTGKKKLKNEYKKRVATGRRRKSKNKPATTTPVDASVITSSPFVGDSGSGKYAQGAKYTTQSDTKPSFHRREGPGKSHVC